MNTMQEWAIKHSIYEMGNHENVNQQNVLDHLAAVERQANRLLNEYVRSQVIQILKYVPS